METLAVPERLTGASLRSTWSVNWSLDSMHRTIHSLSLRCSKAWNWTTGTVRNSN